MGIEAFMGGQTDQSQAFTRAAGAFEPGKTVEP